MSRVLLIEDDQLGAHFVQQVLSAAGHSVVVATNALDALDNLETTPFDLVISDANLPGGASGFDLVRTIRNLAGSPAGMPIAFLTGRGDPEDVKRALVCGVDDYMVKPVDSEILIAKVNTLLNKSIAGQKQFASRKVAETAQIEIEINMTSFSEGGACLVTPFPLDIKSRLKLNCALFHTIGIGAQVMRVVTCQRLESPAHSYAVDTVFVGASEAMLQLIRRWIICNPKHD